MKKNPMIILGIFTMLTSIVGCDSRAPSLNNMDSDLAERLPEDQRDIVLDKALAEIRSQRLVKQFPDGSTMLSDGVDIRIYQDKVKIYPLIH